MQSLAIAVSALLGLLTNASHAQAPTARAKVVLFESAGIRPSLCAALRIQLADIADVDCRKEQANKGLQTRIANAVAQLSVQSAQLGVFLERDDVEVRMYLVAGRSDEAVLAVENMLDRAEPDLDRSLALKVRDALDGVRLAQQVADQGSQDNSLASVALRPASPAASAPAAEQPTQPRRGALFLEVGGGVRVPLRGQAQMALGWRWLRPPFHVELGGAARIFSTIEDADTTGRIEEQEWGAGLTLRALRHFARFDVGGVAETQLHVAHARGTTRAGSSGAAQLTLPSFALGLDGRVHLWAGAFLRFAPSVEVFPLEQRFSLNQRVQTSLGRAHFVAPISLIVQLPWSPRD